MQNLESKAQEYANKIGLDHKESVKIFTPQSFDGAVNDRIAIDAGAKIVGDFRPKDSSGETPSVHCGYRAVFMQALTHCSIDLFRAIPSNRYPANFLGKLLDDLEDPKIKKALRNEAKVTDKEIKSTIGMINKIISKEITPAEIVQIFNNQGDDESKRNVAVLVELGRNMTNHLGKEGGGSALADNQAHLEPLLNRIAGVTFSLEDLDKFTKNNIEYMPHHVARDNHWQANFSFNAVNDMIQIEAQVAKEREEKIKAAADKKVNAAPVPKQKAQAQQVNLGLNLKSKVPTNYPPFPSALAGKSKDLGQAQATLKQPYKQQPLVLLKPSAEALQRKMMAQQSALGSVLGTISEWLRQATRSIKNFVKKVLHISDSPGMIR